jgi:hypothetical protein
MHYRLYNQYFTVEVNGDSPSFFCARIFAITFWRGEAEPTASGRQVGLGGRGDVSI